MTSIEESTELPPPADEVKQEVEDNVVIESEPEEQQIPESVDDTLTVVATSEPDAKNVEPPPGPALKTAPAQLVKSNTSKDEKPVSKTGKGKKPKMGRKYTFFVGPGNNSELVRQTIERRPWWELGKEDDPELNLRWLQVRNRTAAEWVRRMGSAQFLNHLDGLTSIGRKNELYSNLKAYCDSQRINVHEIAPPTFIVSCGDSCPEYAEFARICRQMESRSTKGASVAKSVKNALSAVNGMHGAAKPASSEAASESGASAATTDEAASEDQAPSQSNGANSVTPKRAAGGGKAGAAGAIAAAAQAANSPSKREGKATAAGGAGSGPPGVASKGKMNRADAIAATNTAGDRNIWIVKPTNNNRGNGIRVFKSFAAIDAHLQKKPPGSQVIVQKYIERPLLYRRRKFDIRCLVMVDPLMQIYVYRNAYLRTSSMEYSLDNVHDLFIHLTNYAVQKKNKKLDKSSSAAAAAAAANNSLDEDELDEDEEMEEGNNLNLEQLSAFMREEHPGHGDATGVMNRIKEIVVLVFMSVWKRLNPLRERNTFEVFGWDFLLDEEFRVWLIEVNTNPYIGCSSAILRGIFTGMLEGACRKCIDPFFPPPEGYSVADIEDVEGGDLWEKVYPADKDPAAKDK